MRPTIGVTEAAKRLGIRGPHLRSLARQGTVPAYLIGARWRFDPAELDAWLQSQRVGPEVST